MGKGKFAGYLRLVRALGLEAADWRGSAENGTSAGGERLRLVDTNLRRNL